jgi:hypothetical protein
MAAKKNVLKDISVTAAANPVAYNGLIDIAHPDTGVSGWITSPQAMESLPMEVMLEGVLLHQFVALRNDRDESGAAAAETRFEFALSSQNLGFVADPASDFASGKLSIRVASSDFRVPCSDALAWAAASPEDTAVVEIVRNHDLFDHLGHLKANSSSLLSYPLRPRPDQHGGFIEALCSDDQAAGLYWFIGWKYASDVIDTSAILVDDKKFSASFSIASFPREDLPAGAHGIIGVIRTEWRPREESRPIIYFGNEAEQNLRCVSELRTLSKSDFLTQLQWARQRAPKNNWADLFALITEQGSWVLNSGNRPDVHLAVDRVIVLDGCGCFVTGWALSFVHPVVSFALKFGSEVLAVDPESLRFTERTDLAQAFPGAQHIQSRAGFLCFFEGNLDMRLTDNPQIKAILENGQSVVFPIEIRQVRRLGYSEPIETLEQFYPSIQNMHFFGKIADSIRENYRRMASEVTIHKLAERDACLVIACPDNTMDTHLILDQVLRKVPQHLPADWGIVLAVGPKVSQGWLPSMMTASDSELLDRLSIVVCSKPTAIVQCLPQVLALVGAQRFAVVGDGVLTDEGWAGMKALGDVEDLVFLEAVDPHGDRKLEQIAASFAWNTASFKAAGAKLPVLIDEQLCRDDFRTAQSSSVAGATNLLRRLMPSRMASLINTDARKRNAAEIQSHRI